MTAPLLEVERLAVSYGAARAVFDVSLRVEEGRALCVLGANGAGKSSLASAIAGVVRPAAGRVRLCGADITGWPSY
ncbi:MAG: ABC transporter ATP-binding protein, partial [Acidimicrobiia bacterium]